jgi:purine-binding chemotaxis protein CheW
VESPSKLRARRKAADPRRARGEVKLEALLAARAERYAHSTPLPPTIDCTVVTFRRCGSRYAMSLRELCEIRPLARWCRLPGAGAAVPGVVHYRGELLTLLDLAQLSAARDETTSASWVLVLEHAGERLGLMADEVMDVLELAAGSIQPLPLTLGENGDNFVGMSADGVLIADAARLMAAQLRAHG